MKFPIQSLFAACATLCFAAPAFTQAQAQTYPEYTSLYVNDFAGLIDPETESRLDTLLRQAKSARDLEATIVTIDSRNDYGSSPTLKDFATGLFNAWGIGNADRNDGILILVARSDREMRIVLGGGYPAVFDDRAKRVIDHHFLPAFKKGDYSAGIEAGTVETLKRMQLDFGADNRPTFLSRAKNESQNVYDNARTGGFWAWFAGFLGLGGAGIGLFGVRRMLRFRPRTCDLCNRRMHRLAEFEDDQYLAQGQRVEEALKSKDYDVWYCQYDDHTMIEGYKSWFSQFAACPSCSYKTLHSDRTIITAATTSHSGRAKVDYSCRNCNHAYSETVIIPQKSESSSSSSGSSGFGGGSSSGGGAGGSW